MTGSDVKLKQHKCENCGANISVNVHECPYCGGINYVGAKKKYFRELANIKDNLKQLEKIPMASYKKEASVQIKRIVKTILICAFFIAFLSGGIFLFSRWEESTYSYNSADAKEQLLWDQENFPLLDEWYEAGEYDKLLELRYELYSKDKVYTYYNWKHEDFINVYEDYSYAIKILEEIDQKENYSEFEILTLIYSGLTICYNLEGEGLSEDEIGKIEVYKPLMETVLFDTLEFTEEEALQLYKDAAKNGFIYYDKIEEYSKIVIKRLNQD